MPLPTKRKFKLNSGVKEMPLPTREEKITATERLNLIEELFEKENDKEARKHHSVLINSLANLSISEKERLILITYRMAEYNLSFNLFDSVLNSNELKYYCEMVNFLTLPNTLQANSHGTFCQKLFYAQCAANVIVCLHPLPESEKNSPYTRLTGHLLTAVKKEMFDNTDGILKAMLQSADELDAYHREQLMLQAHSIVNFKLQQKVDLQSTDKVYRALIEKGLIEKQALLAQIQFYRRAGDTYLQHQHYLLALPYYTRALNLLEIANGFTQDCEKSIGVALRAQRTALELVLTQLEIKQTFLYIEPVLKVKIHQFNEQEQERNDQRKNRPFTGEEENTLFDVERQFIESCWADIQIIANQLVIIEVWPEINQLYRLLQPMLDSYQKRLTVLFRDADTQTYNLILEEQVLTYTSVLEKHHQFDRARLFYINLRDYLDNFPNTRKVSAELLDRLSSIELGDITASKDSANLNADVIWHKFRQVLQSYRSNVQEQLKIGVTEFNNAQRQYSNNIMQLLEELSQHVHTVLGKAPCEFCFAITGSAGLQALSIKSDIDVLIIINDNKFRGHCWFRQFIQLLQLYLHELGDVWTLTATEKASLGFAKQSLGLHIDIGDIDHLLDDNINNCWLINTPAQLAQWVIGAKSDDELIIAYGLHWPKLIYASEQGEVLLSSYCEELRKPCKPFAELVNNELNSSILSNIFKFSLFTPKVHLNTTKPTIYELAKKYLHIHKKTLQMIFKKAVKDIDLKQDIIRPLIHFCLDLALYFNCVDLNKELNISVICDNLLQVKHSGIRNYHELIEQIKLTLDKLYPLRWQLEANNCDITNLTVRLDGITGESSFRIGLTQDQYNFLIAVKEQILVKVYEAVNDLITPKKTAYSIESLLHGKNISIIKDINAYQYILLNSDLIALQRQSFNNSLMQFQIYRILNVKSDPLVNFPKRGLLQLSKTKQQNKDFNLQYFNLLNVLLGGYLTQTIEPSAVVLEQIAENFENNNNYRPTICCYAILIMRADIFGLEPLQISSIDKKLKTLLTTHEKSIKFYGNILHSFAEVGNVDVIKYLLTNCLKNKPINKLLQEFRWSSNRITPLHIAAGHGYLDIVQLFFQYGADITRGSLDGHGQTCLHLAAENGYENVVEFLLQHSQINEILQVTYGAARETALQLAAKQGHLGVVKQLVEKAPALLNIPNYCGDLPIQTAAFSNSIKRSAQDEICEYLWLHNHALLNQDAQEKLLECAIEHGLINTVRKLFAQGIKMKHPVKLLETLADHAFNKSDMVNGKRNAYMQILVDLIKSDIDTTCSFESYRGNLMHRAAQVGCKEVVQALIAKGDKMIAISGGYFPLHGLAEYGEDNGELAEILIAADPSVVNKQNDSKRTPLHYAAERGHYQVVQTLLNHQADVNIKNSQGKTPLHLIAQNNCIENKYEIEDRYTMVVQKLLITGAKVDETDQDGMTAIQLAKNARHEWLYKILQDPQRFLANNLPEPQQQIYNEKEEHIEEESFDLFDNYRSKRNRVSSIVESPSSSNSLQAEEFLNTYSFSVKDDDVNSQIFYENNNSDSDQEDTTRNPKRMRIS